jgi:molecular chaperone GrpE
MSSEQNSEHEDAILGGAAGGTAAGGEAMAVADDTGAAGQAEEDSASTPFADDAPSLEEQIAALEQQVAGLSDQYLRKAADFENFRKRMNKEKAEAIDFANQSLLLDIIPVLDDFERALKAAESSAKTEADFNALLEGIGMVEKRLVSQLENKWNLKRYDSAGTAFNPEIHEALMMEKSAEVTEAVVAEEFMKGYTLRDRVIRSAKVKVLMPQG